MIEPFDGDRDKWTAIEYFEFWDFARLFVCDRGGRRFVFEAPFLPLDDEYSDYFIIREIPSGYTHDEIKCRASSIGIGQILPVSEITLDETRRKFILSQCLDRFESSEQNGPDNPRPCGTSGMSPADPASRAGDMPEASGGI